MAADIILGDEISLVGGNVSVKLNMKVGKSLSIGSNPKRTFISSGSILTNRVQTPKIQAKSAEIGDLNIVASVGEVAKPGKITIGNGASKTVISDKKITTSGIISAKKFTELSDARCKQDINVLSNSLDKIVGLQGVSFSWEENELTGLNPPKEKQVGFIAQDVEKILPEAVIQDSKGRRSLAYNSIIPLLVEGIKTQQENIQVLTENIRLISEENKHLTSRVSHAEHRLSEIEKKLDTPLSHS